MNVSDAQVLSRETVEKAFDLLMNPDYPQRAEAAKRDVALYNWLTKAPQGPTRAEAQ